MPGAETFRASAEAYDRFVGRYGPGLASALIAFAGVEPGMRALDVGCGPGLLARPRIGSHATTHGPGPYLEADCDVASSSMAFVLVSLLQSWSKYLVIDLAFTIEPREEEAMPEVVVGCLRLSRINMDRCP